VLDPVEAGEEAVITRRGRSVARLIWESGGEAESGDWVARLCRFPLVSADQNLLAAAYQLGCHTVVVPSAPGA